jgi:VanZ family protein
MQEGRMMKPAVKIHMPTIVYALAVFVLSSIPSLKGPDLGFALQDKVLHMLEFGVFGLLLQRSIFHHHSIQVKRIVLVLILGIGYGGLDEIHQLFISGREASLGDFLADGVGIVLSCILYLMVKRIRQR